LEAFAYQKPVLAANTSSIPEVAGDAALLINPNDIDEIAASMKKLITDVKFKESLLEKMDGQLRKFNWDVAVLKTIKVLVA
jgi:glycosyltransferase involved in cell wall biosynthesis